MTAFSDQNTSIEFVNEQTIHMTLNTGGLTTQLLREFAATSKAHTCETAKALIISTGDLTDPERLFRKVCHKSEHIVPGTFIALICNSPFVYQSALNYLQQNNPTNMVAIFSDYNRGLDWAESKLMGSETIRTLAIALENIFGGMTA